MLVKPLRSTQYADQTSYRSRQDFLDYNNIIPPWHCR